MCFGKRGQLESTVMLTLRSSFEKIAPPSGIELEPLLSMIEPEFAVSCNTTTTFPREIKPLMVI